MSHAIILPICDDNNRGDQALVWETRRLAQKAGVATDYYYLKVASSPGNQSREEGLCPLEPLLRHPSEVYKPKSNMRYSVPLILIWGAISLGDTFRCLLLLTGIGRKLVRRTLSVSQRRTLRLMSTSSICLVKGGGFIHSTGSITDPYRAFYALFHILLAHSLGRKVAVMPNSFGPINGRLYRRIVTYALAPCILLTARESRSRSALAEVGLESELFPDLAFSLRATRTPAVSVEEIRSSHGSRPLVAITARPYRFPGSSDPSRAYANYVAQLADFAEQLNRNGYVPVFVEHVISEGDHESDYSAIRAIASRLAPNSYELVQHRDFNCRELKAFYGLFDFVVGTRFHSVIFAMSEGVPAIAISYGGNKGRGIMEDCDLADYVLGIDEFTAEAAIEKFLRLVHDEETRERVAHLGAELGSKHEELARLLADRAM